MYRIGCRFPNSRALATSQTSFNDRDVALAKLWRFRRHFPRATFTLEVTES